MKKHIPFRVVLHYAENLKPRETLTFSATSVGRQDVELLISVKGSGIEGTYCIQDDRTQPELLFREHMQDFSDYGQVTIDRLSAQLYKDIQSEKK